MAFEYFKVFLLVMFLTWTPRAMYGLSHNEKIATIRSGLESGKALADVLKEGKFRESLVKLGKNLAPYLGVLGPLVGFILAFSPQGESAELKFMKKKFAEVSNKLDIISSEFNEVRLAIEWSSLKNSYGGYARKIRAAEVDLNTFYASPQNHTNGPKKEFLNSYDHFDNSLQQLYDGCMRDDYPFSNNILDTVIKKTKNHRGKFHMFSLGIIQLLIKGIKVKVTAYTLKGYKLQNIKNLQKLWIKNMRTLGERLDKKSDEITGKYTIQLKLDVEDMIRRHHSLGNGGLMKKIYYFIVEKYDWRYWFVVVYDDITGFDEHTSSCDGTLILLHQLGAKNVVITSHDKINFLVSWFIQSDENKIHQKVNNDIKKCKLTNGVDRENALVWSFTWGKKTKYYCVPNSLILAVTLREHLADLWWLSWNSHREPCNCSIWSGCDNSYWHHTLIACVFIRTLIN